jgi:hypothetical protein
VAVRAELNYKYLWMHAGEHGWMGATATMDTPLHRRAFAMHPVNGSCAAGNGWVRLREGDSQGFLMMVAPTGDSAVDEWVVRVGSDQLNVTDADGQYHFLLEDEGYLLNRGSMAFVNVMPEAEYSVRGHTGGWDRTKAAGREYGAAVKFTFLNASLVEEAVAEEAAEEKETEEEDKAYREQIAALPTSTEKRVISFGLYGAKDKYTHGALRNAELAEVYFPGWVCRFYVTSDVPADVVSALKKLGAEVEEVPSGMGYSSGMFWRFMPAVDASVDRFIVRDVDSRLNARDRLAVEAWIESKYPVHVVRDHVNHCLVMNGGMWGAVKGAIPDMKDLVMAWSRCVAHTHAFLSFNTLQQSLTSVCVCVLAPFCVRRWVVDPSTPQPRRVLGRPALPREVRVAAGQGQADRARRLLLRPLPQRRALPHAAVQDVSARGSGVLRRRPPPYGRHRRLHQVRIQTIVTDLACVCVPF